MLKMEQMEGELRNEIPMGDSIRIQEETWERRD